MSNSRKPGEAAKTPELLDDAQIDSAVGGATKSSQSGGSKSRGGDHEIEYDIVAAK